MNERPPAAPAAPPRPFTLDAPDAPAPPPGSVARAGRVVSLPPPRADYARRAPLASALRGLHRGRPVLELRERTGPHAADPFDRAWLGMHPGPAAVLASVDILARYLHARPEAAASVYGGPPPGEPTAPGLRLLGGVVVGLPGPASDTGAGHSGPLSGPVACPFEPEGENPPELESAPVASVWDYLDSWPGDPLTGYAAAWLWGFVGAGLDGRTFDQGAALLCDLWPDARGDAARAARELQARLHGGAWGPDALAFRSVLRYGYERHGADDAARLLARYHGVPDVRPEPLHALARG